MIDRPDLVIIISIVEKLKILLNIAQCPQCDELRNLIVIAVIENMMNSSRISLKNCPFEIKGTEQWRAI